METTPPFDLQQLVTPPQVPQPPAPGHAYVPVLVSVGVLAALTVIRNVLHLTGQVPALTTDIVSLVAFVAAVVALVAQVRLFRTARPRLLKLEFWFALAVIILPTICLAAADQVGAAHFGTPSNIHGQTLVLLAVGSACTVASLLAVANALYIALRFHKAAKIIAGIFYGLFWVVLAGVSYVVYSFEYSLHDPSTE